jgi:hypothetical protein
LFDIFIEYILKILFKFFELQMSCFFEKQRNFKGYKNQYFDLYIV